MQIFADQYCSQLPTGLVTKVYARVNTAWVGEASGWMIDSGTDGGQIVCIAPEGGENTYGIQLWVDFFSGAYNDPFSNGQVIELHNQLATDVTDYQKVFSKP